MYRPPPAMLRAFREGWAVVEHKKKQAQGRVGPSTSDCDEAYLVLLGELEILRGRSWAPAPPGTLAFHPARKRYGIRPKRGYNGPARIVSILFRAPRGWQPNLPRGPIRLGASWWRRFLDLEAQADYSASGQRVLPVRALMDLLEKLGAALNPPARGGRRAPAEREPRKPDTQAGWLELWARAEDAIRERAAGGLTAAELAEALHVSPTQLRRVFNAARGLPPKAALTAWRLDEAKRLLREGRLNAGEVAARVGYASLPRFSAAFKAATGEPPSRYAESVFSTGPRRRRSAKVQER
ncbi:MAG: AraC family transcriptional regulator [Planctomycetota bacterium]|nr:AraC family transcriptional regulator [Planctomycetota bacterium]